MNKFFTNLKNATIFFFKHHIYIMLLLFIIDIVSKLIMESILQYEGNEIVIIKGFFSLKLVYNPGSFSGFLGNIPYGTFILMCLSLIGGIVAIVYFIKKFKTMNIVTSIALYLLIPGCFGNMVDRFLKVIGAKAGVIDFLAFNLPIIGEFPVFNFADICLTIAMFLILGSLVYFEIKEYKNNKEEKINEDKSKSVEEIYKDEINEKNLKEDNKNEE